MNQTGKASIDRPWENLYPPQLLAARGYLTDIQDKYTVRQFLEERVTNKTLPILEYYGKQYTLGDLYTEADKIGASMAAMGVKEGDAVCAFLRSTPEYLMLFFACEKLGAILLCVNNSPEENLETIRRAEAPFLFAHDFLPREVEQYYYENSHLQHIVMSSPYYYCDREQIPDYIQKSIDDLYAVPTCCDSRNITWADFLEKGKSVDYDWSAPADPKRPLCNPYTSGSTGKPKEIIHCAASMLGVISQISFPNAVVGKTVLQILFPPTMIATLNAAILYNLTQMSRVIMDPFCEPKDLDLELMRYRPWMTMMVPCTMELLLNSERIPADYDMSFLEILGGGADPTNNKWLDNLRAWLNSHNCHASYTQVYGQSECCSSICMDMGNKWYDCCGGAPLILNTVGIFDPDTEEELDYGRIGEICANTPGMMLGYGGVSAGETPKVLRTHKDGRVFVHTGDFGYIDSNGFVYVMGRGRPKRWGYDGKYIFCVPIENRVVALEEILDCYCIIPQDKKHPGYVLPYLYVKLAPGCLLDDALRAKILSVLEPHEYPIDIRLTEKREYFAFKLNRRGMAERLLAEQD